MEIVPDNAIAANCDVLQIGYPLKAALNMRVTINGNSIQLFEENVVDESHVIQCRLCKVYDKSRSNNRQHK